ncbi:hypothetical protein SAMN02910451_02651 [Butyrivibrio hungatei]|uniref:Uncharacterized protein n=1 Tax=Butyrivibrio hungatei TaxID=185008 RepID=A0A1G5FZM5_9FIRM|nr:hypothetical protein [Butyrivibrio hungatei]SCY44802.1 hypothetical protein SAMN02910451_02651 [Butyrivibrio hungatei]
MRQEAKYNEFYLINDDREHYLYELYCIDNEEYLRKYDGNMYCPMCRKAQLSRVRGKKSIFLRTNHGQEHGIVDGEVCEYAFDRKTVIETEKHIIDLKETNRLGAKLNTIMLQLKKKDVVRDSSNIMLEAKRPTISKSSSSSQTHAKRLITPKYSFLNWGINTPQDHLIIAYGDVYICVGNTTKEYTYLRLYADETKTRLLTSFAKPYRTKISDGYYHVVSVGTCIKKDKYYNFKIYDYFNGLLIEPIKII